MFAAKGSGGCSWRRAARVAAVFAALSLGAFAAAPQGCKKGTACVLDADCAQSCSDALVTGERCTDGVCKDGDAYDCQASYGASYTCGTPEGETAPRCVPISCADDDDCADVCRDDGLLLDYGCGDEDVCVLVAFVDGCGGAGGAGGAAGGGGSGGGGASGGGGTGGGAGGTAGAGGG